MTAYAESLHELAVAGVKSAAQSSISDQKAERIATTVVNDTLEVLRRRILNTVDPQDAGVDVRMNVIKLLDEHRDGP